MAGQATAQHRAAQMVLRTQTVRDLTMLWPALDVARLDATYPAWFEAVSLLVNRNRRTSAGLSARYLTVLRGELVGGRFDPVLAGDAPPEQIDTSLHSLAVANTKKAAASGQSLTTAARNAFVLSSGAASRLVLEAGRQTVIGTVKADPRASGYRRVLGGGGCAFCRLLVGRGAVYGAESVEFQAHDHCACSAEPVYT